jgi:hypothetical protein
MSKNKNPVAKFQRKYNKAKVFLDRKREYKKNGEHLQSANQLQMKDSDE